MVFSDGLLGACSCSTLFRAGPLLWSGQALLLPGHGSAVGEPAVCSLSPWALFSFGRRGRASAAHCSATFWRPGVQGDLGQSGKATFKLPFPLGSTCLPWPGSAQYLQLLILAPLVPKSKGKIPTPVF